MASTTTGPNNRSVSFKTKVAREPKRTKSIATKAMRRGLISPKAAARHLKGV